MSDTTAAAPAAPAAPAQAPSTPQHQNTRDRLFGQDVPKPSPKKTTPTYKSSIFSDEPPASPQRTPKKSIPKMARNPITGEVKPVAAAPAQQITV